MARKKLSEYKAKSIVSKELGITFTSYSYDSTEGSFADHQKSLDVQKKYVVKVDQGVKGRFKKGLVKTNVLINDLGLTIDELSKKGFSQFIIEPQIYHEASDEKYISLERIREGIRVYYSSFGGVNIEQNKEKVGEVTICLSGDLEKIEEVAKSLGLDKNIVETLRQTFNKYYFSFLEINPFIIHNSKFIILDCAVEVDSTAEFFVNGVWAEQDSVEGTTREFEEVKNVKELASKSTAAFSLTVLNPDGCVGMLLSSGGASIVTADEVGNEGFGKQLLNYGEYSGGPNTEETYIYSRNILSLLLNSKAPQKVLIVAGGVANFTDIRITFAGIIKALSEVSEQLRQQRIKVFVRRGGPNQDKGLSEMKTFLQKENLYGDVKGPDMVLTDIVKEAIEYVKH